MVEAAPLAPAESVARPRGRPRDRATSQRLLDAALAVLSERGFSGTTVRAIAERAGVGLPALYRRWESKEALLFEAVSAALQRAVPDADLGDVRADLVALVDAEIRVLSSGQLGGVLRALIGQSLEDSTWRDVLVQLHRRRRAANRMIVRRGVARGELAPGTDPDVLLDLLHGPLWLRLLTSDTGLSPAAADGLVDVALAAVRAAPTVPPSPGASDA